MNTAKQVAQDMLVLSNPEIGAITSNLKLQKLLYYAQGVHLAAFDTPNCGTRNTKKATLHYCQ